MAEIQYRCEVAEKKRARSAWERSQEEKLTALQNAAEEAEKKKQEEMRNLTENLTKRLRNETALQKEIALGEALAAARVNHRHHVSYRLQVVCNFGDGGSGACKRHLDAQFQGDTMQGEC